LDGADTAGASDVIEHRQIGDEVERLKDEANLLVPQAHEFAVGEWRDRRAVDLDASAVGSSSRPMMLSGVLLPQPDGPIAATNSFVDGDVDVRQRDGFMRSVR
jgi:hypothetical protein